MNPFKSLRIIVSGMAIVILVLISILLYYSINSRNPNDGKIVVNIDKTVIVEKVQKLNRLETVRSTIQRDLEISLDLGNFDLFGQRILENKRVQKYAVTGFVSAGVDLSKLNKDKISFDEKNNSITLNIDSPIILFIKIDEDKTALIKDDLSILFRIQTLNDDKRKEVNEILRKQAVKQSEEALRDGACKSEILKAAGENAKSSIQNLFLFSNIKEINVNVAPTQNCTYSTVTQ